MESRLASLEDELRHPLWWDSLKEQVDHIPSISRKLEHLQLDVNVLRDTHFTASPSSSNDPKQRYGGGNSSSTSKKEGGGTASLIQLAGEIEGVKLLVRRVESHQAVELNVFSQIRELQRYSRVLHRLLDERAPSGALDEIRSSISKHVNDLMLRQDGISHAAGEARAQLKESLLKTIPHMVREESAKIYEEKNPVALDALFVAKGLYEESKTEMTMQISTTRSKLDGLLLNLKKQTLTRSMERIKKGIAYRLGQKQRDLIQRWARNAKRIAEAQRVRYKRQANDFVPKVYRVFARFGLKLALDLWAEKVAEQKHWELYRDRLVIIVKYWKSRVEPNVAFFLRRWRVNAILSRGDIPAAKKSIVNSKEGGEVRRSAAAGSDGGGGEVASGDGVEDEQGVVALAAVALTKIKDLPSDLEGASMKISVVGDFIKNLAFGQQNAENEAVKQRKDIMRVNRAIDATKTECMLRIDSQVSALASHLQTLMLAVNMSLSEIKVDQEVTKTFNAAQISRVTNLNEKLEARVRALEDRASEHDSKFERVMLLNGDILTRVEKLEKMEKKLCTKASDSAKSAEEAKGKVEAAMVEVEKLNKTVSDSLFFFDEEVKNIKRSAKQVDKLLSQLTKRHEHVEGVVAATGTDFSSRIKSAEEILLVLAPPSALPTELAEMCFGYEDMLLSNSGFGKTSTDMPLKLCQSIANFAKRLAKNISDVAHVEALERMVSGPQEAPPIAGAAGAFPNNIFAERRDEMILQFNQAFVDLLRSKDDAPGYVRSMARVVFHRRFTAALNLALQRLNGEGASNLEGTATSLARGRSRNQREAACIACDRPLSPSSRPASSTGNNRHRVDSSSPSREKGFPETNTSYELLTESLQAPYLSTPFLQPNGQGQEEEDQVKGDFEMSTTTNLWDSNAGSRRGVLSKTYSAKQLLDRTLHFSEKNKLGESASSISLLALQQQNHSNNNKVRPASAGAVRHRSAVKESEKLRRREREEQIVNSLVGHRDFETSIPFVHHVREDEGKEDDAKDEISGTLHAMSSRRLVGKQV